MLETQLAQYLQLTFTPGVGVVTFLRLLQQFGDVANVYAAGQTEVAKMVGKGVAGSIFSDNALPEVEKTLKWLSSAPQRFLLTLVDDEYPAELAEIAMPPTVLFMEGQRELLSGRKVAMVGSRHPTQQGIQNALAFGGELAAAGVTVVSGLAAGIDRYSHEGALTVSGGRTIAVIGTGIDLVYPASNRELFQRIRHEGLLISEYPLATPALANNFPRRNRIIVGLSQACLVVESAIDGGSMISADFALEMGRDVLAIPGSIHNPMARGCHKLIKQGAKLCETVSDVLEELAQSAQKNINLSAVTEKEDIILSAMGFDPVSLDLLCARLNLDFGEMCGKLLEYELEGKIVSCGGGRYQRVFK